MKDKYILKKITSIVMFMFLLASLTSSAAIKTAEAATGLNMNGFTIQGYAYTDSHFPVYNSTGSGKKQIGTCYGNSDYIIIHGVGQDGWSKITYPIKNGTKTGYCWTEFLFQNTEFQGITGEVKSNITTYRKPNCKTSYGALTTGDNIFIIGYANENTQVLYPCKKYYKIGWINGTYKIENGTLTKQGNNLSASNNNNSITVFSQHDSRWANVSYGKGPNGENATLSSSGCGVLAYVNAVYYMTGEFIQPSTLAAWSVNNGYRINGSGTSHGLYKAFADSYGASYGFKYSRNVNSIKSTRSHLSNGGVAIISVPNHLMALVSYENGKYLILDSYKSSSRGTQSSGYRWVTESQFKGKLEVSDIILLSKR